MDTLSVDAAGWIAAALTACCFACTRMLRLRALALAANIAFIAYGGLAGLAPVLVLHAVLAPLNAWHLWRQWRPALRTRPAAQAPPAGGRPATDTPAALRRRPLRPQVPVRALRPGPGLRKARAARVVALRSR